MNKKIIIAIVVVVLLSVILYKPIQSFYYKMNENNSKSSQTVTSTVESTKKSSSSSSSSTSSPPSTSSDSSATATSLWNADKQSQLATFMIDWGNRMGQPGYRRLTKDSDVDFIRFVNNNHVVVNTDSKDNGQEFKSVEWSTNGEGNSEYNIVDSYIWYSGHVGVNFYLFAIHNGQPVVLVSNQTQGNERNALYVWPSENADLQNKFAEIVNS